MSFAMSLVAIGWEPEIRGILTVIIGGVVLCGSVYLLLATNIGARLGFLVALTGLAGWMALMGAVWWIYGIGLRGPDPSWEPVEGATVLQDDQALVSAGALNGLPQIPDDATATERALLVNGQFVDEGWVTLDPASPGFGQAQAAASVYLEEEGAFAAGQFQITEVFDTGGDRWPKINDSLDFLAFFHSPHYVVAEASTIEPVRTEPGRAPATPVIDESRQRVYVYMIRDLGAVRQPAAVLTIGGGAIFLALCYLLHRRERILRENLAMPIETTEPTPVEATSAGAEADDREPVGAST
ncbi:MAG: hypothetical protein AAFY28_13310 [Actinomycetota bacterium]